MQRGWAQLAVAIVCTGSAMFVSARAGQPVRKYPDPGYHCMGVYSGRKAGTTKRNPARAAELRARGLTDYEIAEAMGVSRRTVQRYLKD